MFTKCLGLEYARHHIRCNVVSPGSTDTEMQRLLWKDDHGARSIIEGGHQYEYWGKKNAKTGQGAVQSGIRLAGGIEEKGQTRKHRGQRNGY